MIVIIRKRGVVRIFDDVVSATVSASMDNVDTINRCGILSNLPFDEITCFTDDMKEIYAIELQESKEEYKRMIDSLLKGKRTETQ